MLQQFIEILDGFTLPETI